MGKIQDYWTFLVWNPFTASLLTVKNQSNKIKTNKKIFNLKKKESTL